MAGKSLIGGTAYTISGGKTLVDGTVYGIAGGKTMLDGTAYEIGIVAKINVTITSAGSKGNVYALSSETGESIYSVGTYTFTSGSTLTLYAKSRTTTGSSFIYVDGETVARTSAGKTATYILTLDRDINIAMKYSSTSSINVTTV